MQLMDGARYKRHVTRGLPGQQPFVLRKGTLTFRGPWHWQGFDGENIKQRRCLLIGRELLLQPRR